MSRVKREEEGEGGEEGTEISTTPPKAGVKRERRAVEEEKEANPLKRKPRSGEEEVFEEDEAAEAFMRGFDFATVSQEGLDEDQTAAARLPLVSAVVEAGPGSGKTRTLVARFEHVVKELGQRAEDVLAVTFSNSAMEEMGRRLWEKGLRGFQASTLDARAYAIAFDGVPPAERPEMVTSSRDPAVLACTKALRAVIKDIRSNPRQVNTVRSILSMRLCVSAPELRVDDVAEFFGTRGEMDLLDEMSQSSSFGLLVQQVKHEVLHEDHREGMRRFCAGAAGAFDDARYARLALLFNRFTSGVRSRVTVRVLHALVALYERQPSGGANNEDKRLDFCDVTSAAIIALEDRPEAVRFRPLHVLLDELQDTSPLQLKFLRALVPEGGTVFAVGDRNQCIYEWRSARSGAPALVREAWRGSRSMVLRNNYRSSAEIVRLSNYVMRHLLASGSEPRTSVQGPSGLTPTRSAHRDAQGEARATLARVLKLLGRGTPRSEVAVLSRSNLGTYMPEVLLTGAGVVVRKREEKRVFRLRPYKALLSAFEALVGDGLAASKRQTMVKPSIGDVEEGSHRKTDLVANAQRFINAFGGSAARKAGSAAQAAAAFFEDVYRKGTDAPDVGSSLETHVFVTRAAALLTATTGHAKGLSVADFLRYRKEVDTLCYSESDGVFCETIHQSKGMEFEAVFLVDCTSFHFSRAGQPDSNRALYVALSRAKRLLHVSHGSDVSGGNGADMSLVEAYLAAVQQQNSRTDPFPGVLLSAGDLLKSL